MACIMGSLFQGTDKRLTTPRSITTSSSHLRCCGAARLLSFTRRHCSTTMACIMGNLFQATNKGLTTRSSHLRLGAARHVSFSTRAKDTGVIKKPKVTENLPLSSSTLPFRTSPWLMLPPKDPMVNKFYSLEKERVIPIYKRHMTSDHGMEHDPVCIGSSHGWLVYINRRDLALFLYNPISHRIIKLPSIHTLPEDMPDTPCFFIQKLILSSSPVEEEEEEDNRCVAMCIYGCAGGLAFCRPGHDTAWIPLDENLTSYKAIAYSSKDKLFYSFNTSDELDCWDLRDPSLPKRKFVAYLLKEEGEGEGEGEIEGEGETEDDDDDDDGEEEEEEEEEEEDDDDDDDDEEEEGEEEDEEEGEEEHHWRPFPCSRSPEHYLIPKHYLIADPWSNDFLIIERFVADQIREDGSLFTDDSSTDFTDSYPYKTMFFEVYKVDFKNEVMKYMKHSLNDRVLFVGINQSFSLPARDFPHLRPNSIYFTDDGTWRLWDVTWDRNDHTATHGGHDIGIFNYENKVFESCYYPCDLKSIKRIMPPPVWFTPNPNCAFLFPSCPRSIRA